jgi:hypothetical protein
MASKSIDLKADLKKWKEEVFGDVGKKKELLEGIQDMDEIAEGRGLAMEEMMRKEDMTKELEEVSVSWRQKSRVLWLGGGGGGGQIKTQFFHKKANSHQRNNQVESLLINRYMSSNSTEVQEHIVQFYNKFYFEQLTWRPRVDGLSPLSIDEDQSIWFDRDFEEQEVWEVVRDLNGDKVLGPNGFTMAYLQKCWEVVREDIMEVSIKFQSR